MWRVVILATSRRLRKAALERVRRLRLRMPSMPITIMECRRHTLVPSARRRKRVGTRHASTAAYRDVLELWNPSSEYKHKPAPKRPNAIHLACMVSY